MSEVLVRRGEYEIACWHEKETVSGILVGDYLGIHKVRPRGFKVDHIPTGYGMPSFRLLRDAVAAAVWLVKRRGRHLRHADPDKASKMIGRPARLAMMSLADASWNPDDAHEEG